MSLASLIVIFLLLGMYGWLAAVECGFGLLRLLPSSTLTRHALKLCQPAWEAMGLLFLLTGMAGLFVVFRHGWVGIVGTVLPSVVAGVIVVVARFVVLTFMYWRKAKTGLTLLNWLFLVVSLMVPLSFGVASIHLLTGHSFWQTRSGWLLAAMLVVGLCALMLSFTYYVIGQTPRGRLQFLARWLNLLLCLLSTVVLVWVSVHNLPHLLTPSLGWFIGILGFIGVLQLVTWVTKRDRYMWWYLSVVAVLSPMLLMLANRPYLAYPHYTLAAAYGDKPYGLAEVFLLVLLLILLAAGLAALSWRLLSNRGHVLSSHKRTAASHSMA